MIVALQMVARIGRPKTGRKPDSSIRIRPDALRWARDAAVTQSKTLGQGLKRQHRGRLRGSRRANRSWQTRKEGDIEDGHRKL